MSKPNKARFKIEALRSKVEDATEIEFELSGEVFTIPTPQFWPDKALTAAKDGDLVVLAQSLLRDQYEAYTEAGGVAGDLALVVSEYAKDQGVDQGE
ncbi:hypothetical protein O1L55_20730 [Streptomyces albulus]|nr:hypothetical protein [Streptomyces noursei]